MKRFVFRLETVLRYHQTRKKLADARRRLAWQQMRQAEEHVTRLEAQLQQVAQALQASSSPRNGDRPWHSLRAQSQWLSNQIQVGELAVAACRLESVRANDAYKQVAVLVEALVSLKQRRWQAHQAERSAEDQKRIDELGLRQRVDRGGRGGTGG